MQKVIHLVNNRFDGAGIFAKELHNEMINRQIESYYISKFEKVEKYNLRKLISKALHFLFKNKGHMLTIPLLDFDINYKKKLEKIIPKNEKVKVIIYGINPFWKLLRENNSNIEFILYIIDLEPLTSCCHHHHECIRYDNFPRKCSGANYFGQKLINYYYSKKTNFINSKISKIFLENKYSFDLIKKSNQFKFIKNIFLIGLSTRTCTLKKSTAKNKLKKLGFDKKFEILILCSASDCLNERKNIKTAVLAFRNIISKFNNCSLLVVGKNSRVFEDKSKNIFTIENVLIEDYLLITKAADIYLSSSISDLGPTTINQAYSSGCYLCSTKTGSALELIEEGKNGFLVEENCNDLTIKLMKTIELIISSGPLKKKDYDKYNIEKVCSNLLNNLS